MKDDDAMKHGDALAANRANWDDRADVHARSQMYDVEGFLADTAEISGVVKRDLAVLAPHLPEAGIADRTLLHLQCHIGVDTVSWSRLGAVDVHGIDLSPNSLRHAAQIGDADGRSITWIEGDVRFASEYIHRQFQTIVTSTGTIVWLPELENWARSIYELLEPGGLFLIRDDHPLLGAMSFEPWDITDDYLADGVCRTYQDSGTYTENSDGQIEHRTSHEWRHDLSEVMMSLLRAGLRIEAFAELPYMDWPAFPGLVECSRGYALPSDAPRIPLTFAIVARRPETWH